MKIPVMVIYAWNPKTREFDIPVILEKTLPDPGNKDAKPPQPLLLSQPGLQAMTY